MKQHLTFISLIFFALHQINLAVKVSLYYETLCPDSKNFFVRQFAQLHEKFGSDVQLELVPFGNVNEYTDDNHNLRYHCQHGAAECRGNKIHSCVYSYHWSNNRANAVKFYVCMFTQSNWKNVEASAQQCANQYFPGQWNTIHACYDGDEGRDLFKSMGIKTRQLYPSPTGVPWITLNDKYHQEYEQEIFADFPRFICNRMSPKPEACNYMSGGSSEE